MGRLSTWQAWPLNPDKNPLLRAAVRLGVYDYFAGGVDRSEVQQTLERLRTMGYHGAILTFAREETQDDAVEETPTEMTRAVEQWKIYNLQTVDMLSVNDVLALKYTGAGRAVARALQQGAKPPVVFARALDEILDLCLQRQIRVFIDAETQAFQDTGDKWTVDLMRRYNTPNKRISHGCLVYTTLQAYLKKAPSRLLEFLQLARSEGWTLGLKLVRGAYLSSDERSLIHDTKEQTDEAYDSILRGVLLQELDGIPKEEFPRVEICVATHNEASVYKALELAERLEADGRLHSRLDYGQLMGMADELGCRLIQETRRITAHDDSRELSAPNPLKLTVWGSPQECMQWLLRRAIENRDAVGRARQWRAQFQAELWRRLRTGGK
ncbi:proline dehydrogenase [Ascosphaera acerosa]|nr:proline dehydrogenase [Ascosphaera acerosa]